jgi:hypothetical protein
MAEDGKGNLAADAALIFVRTSYSDLRLSSEKFYMWNNRHLNSDSGLLARAAGALTGGLLCILTGLVDLAYFWDKISSCDAIYLIYEDESLALVLTGQMLFRGYPALTTYSQGSSAALIARSAAAALPRAAVGHQTC